MDPRQPALFIIDGSYFDNYGMLTDNGEALSRGIEIMVQKKLARDFYGLASLSFFRSRYQGGDGVWRDRSYDNRITVSIEGGYKPSNKLEFSIRWIYAGGVPCRKIADNDLTPEQIEALKQEILKEDKRDRIKEKNAPIKINELKLFLWKALVVIGGAIIGLIFPILYLLLFQLCYTPDNHLLNILLLLPVYIIVNIKFKPEIENISSAKAFLQEEFHRMGKISRDELITAFISVVTIFFWIAAGHQINVAVISIGAAVFVFVFRIAHWIDLNDYINWGVIIMYGGAIALGRALAETGAIEWLASEAIGASTLSPIMFVIVLSLLSLILTEFISNVAAVVILLPMAYGFIAQTGLSAETVTLIITIPAGLAFCMPISTPPNAIAFSAGYFSMKDLFSIGIVIKLVAWLVFLGVALLYWPLIGFQF